MAARQSRKTSASKILLLASASFAALSGFCPAQAVLPADYLGFATTGSLSAWTTYGTVTTKNTTSTLNLGGTAFSLTPASGEYMASIEATGNSVSLSNVDSVLGLSSGTVNTVLSNVSGGDQATNFGALTETVTLSAGAYTFYWSYAAQDYQPYNDGVLFSLSGTGTNTVSVLASNGPDGPQQDTVVVGSYGATQWASHTFTIATSGTYQLGFAAYNWIDKSVDPILYVGASAGTVTTPGSTPTPTPIDTASDYYLASNLGSSVNPDFKGGTLRVDTSGSHSDAFTVEAYSGNTIDAYGHNGIFSGVFSGSGGLTITDSIGGGTVVFTGADTYSGGTTINAGATLQIGIEGTAGSVTGDIIDNGTLIFNRSDAITYAGTVSGTGSLTQAGVGTLILTGANTYTGGTTIATGTLQIGNGGTSGSVTGDITNNTTLIFNRSDAVTYAGAISGTGSVIQAGSGTLILTGTNTYSGGTSIADGTTLQLGNGGLSGSIAGNVINNGALIYNRSNVAAFDGVISSSGSLHIVRGGLALTGNNTYSGGTTVDSGAVLQIGAGGSTGSFMGNVVNNGTVVFARDNSLSYGGVISGTGNVNVSSGTVVLTGSSTYTGGTSIASGSTLQLGDGGTTGSITGNVVNHGILAFNRSDTVVFTGNVAGDGTLVQTGTGKVIVTTNYTGKTIVNSGVLQIGNASSSGTVTGNIVNNATVVYGQAATTTYSGVISGSGGVAVAGGGIVILNGANTYTGPTTVTAGSLVIGDVSHPGSGVAGTVTVSGAAMIGGYGVIGGSLIAAGGIVSPGNSIGTLTVAGNYAPNSASTLKIEVSPTANDKLVVGGKAHLAGTLALSLQPGTYSTSLKSILTAGSISGTFSTVTYSGGDAAMAYGVVYGAQEVDLAMTPKSSGQIYGDIVTQTLDTAEELNDATIDRLNTTTAAGWSAWSKALSGASHTDGDAGLAEFNSQLWGVISGADYQFSQGSKVSGVFSYTRNQIGVHGEGDKASVEGYFFALAGHVPVDAFAFDVTGFVQHNIVDTVRSKGGVGNASGSTSNLVGGGSLQASYSIDDLKPFIRLTVASIGTGSFKEAGALGFAVGSQTLTSVRGSLGLEASHLFVTENGTRLLPHFMIGMEDEFGDTGRETAITFASTDFTAPAPSPERYSALFGAGLTATLQDKLELSLETRGRISANQYSGILSIGAKYKF